MSPAIAKNGPEGVGGDVPASRQPSPRDVQTSTILAWLLTCLVSFGLGACPIGSAS